jgi:hypothetical protein
MNSFSRLHEESNKIGIEFLLTELDSALAFLAVAQTTASAETRERNRQHACTAYKVVLRMEKKVIMEPRSKDIFEHKFAELKRRFGDAGLELPEPS